MRTLTLLFLAITLALARRQFVEHSQPKTVPTGWKRSAPANPEQILKLHFVLRIRNRQALEDKFWSVSDPTHKDYANYLSLEQISSTFGPSNKDIAALEMFLARQDIFDVKFTLSRDFIEVTLPVKKAERMFQVKFHQFSHDVLPTVIRTLDPYTLPSEIASLVHFVAGVHRFPTKRTLSVKHHQQRHPVSRTSAPSYSDITPQAIWQAFNTKGTTGTNPNNLQGVAQFLGQYFDPDDLSTFEQTYNLPSQPAAKVLGPNDPSNPGTEASLDIQYIIGTAPGIPTWFWSTGDPLHGGQEDFVRWAMDMNNASTIPLVMSVSYGDDESTIDKGWADRLDAELQKLAVRGISVLFASGDDGVGCTDSCKHQPNWPASSPFVTSVGGFVGGSDNSLIGDGISSGGFSNFYRLPAYQYNAVKNYLATGPQLPPAGQYNATSRATPDVSSFSENVIVIQGGGDGFPVGGTSCASPVFAGVVALINDALLNAGKKPLGFLNNALYKIQASNPKAFIDVTIGTNGNGCCTGFTATKGWDPITGLGAPNFPVLRDAFLAFQNKPRN